MNKFEQTLANKDRRGIDLPLLFYYNRHITQHTPKENKMTYFLKSGITFRVSSKEAMDLHETLPAGNYTIKKDPFDNLYLESIDSFEIKGKRYGDLDKNTDRILNTFMDRTASTGVML